jgi:hypothetical protein
MKKTVISQVEKFSTMKAYKLINNLGGWLIFLIAAVVYISTAEPTASFWDCGEYIATSYKLQVGHPPGAPTFQLIGRIFTLFAFGNTENVAFMMNVFSALSSALTIMFLFWTITLLAKKFVIRNTEEISLYEKISVFAAGAIGALAYTFTDSFWFSAVEGEVYALSSFATAITFWAALKWDEQADKPDANRWMLFIAYLVGLSIGVHLLNLLALPAIVFIVYFRKYKFSWKGFVAAGILGIILLGLVLYIIIPLVVVLAGKFELFFINTIRLPFNSGTVIYLLLLVGGLAFGLHYTMKKNKVIVNLVLKSFIFILIGYSTYFMLIIRSNAETPIDENNPSNAINLLAYLQREQYGDTPLFYGPYYTAPISRNEKWGDRSPIYARDEEQKKYVIIDKREGVKPKYEKEFCTVFPRMWNSTESHYISGYENWGKVKGTMINYNNGFSTEMIKKPKFSENLRFFFSYQIGHMYMRYFMWNFAGRQNDIQGHGNLIDGNWISGLNFFDNRLGPQDMFPENMKNNKARNRYYMLPLLLGIAGIAFHIKRKPKDAFVVFVLFLMTGLAIVVYLNQSPYQPRERDYAYAASFYAFAVWLGIGVLAINEFLRRWLKQGIASILLAAFISLIAVPYVLAKENWDDHDRSGRYTARDFAKNYLDSCEPNAILFTNGDNDTFPLWYVQEVEGYRTDVRVVNLSLLNTDWYVNSMKSKAYDGEPVPFSLQPHQYQSGTYDVMWLVERDQTGDPVNIIDLFNILHKEPQRLKLKNQGREFDYFPTKNFRLPVDSARVVELGVVAPEDAHLIVDNIDWRINRSVIYKNGLMLLDLLAHNNWERPIYFAITTGDDSYFGLQDYFQLEGLAYRLVPIRTSNVQGNTGRLHTEKLYQKMVHDFQWGNMEKPGVYLDETNRRMSMNYRNNFARLANQFIIEGDTARAIKSLDRAMELMPDSKVPYNFFVILIAEAYYRAEQLEKGDAILERYLDILDENLRFFFAFKGKKARLISEDREQALVYTNRINQIAEQYQRTEINERGKALFQEYYDTWLNTRQ